MTQDLNEHSISESMMDVWADILSDTDLSIIKGTGYASLGATLWDSREIGSRPGLLIVDLQEMFFGRDVPILEAVTEIRNAMGSIAWNALRDLQPFVEKIRELAVPVIYTRVIPPGRDADDPVLQIVEPLAPQPGDVVIDKRYTSAFFDTDLLSTISDREIDTLIVVGTTTSGCIRSTVVDARQLGLHPIVPIECVFDRVEASHKVGLLDMWMKYAAVLPAEKVLEYAANVMRSDDDH